MMLGIVERCKVKRSKLAGYVVCHVQPRPFLLKERPWVSEELSGRASVQGREKNLTPKAESILVGMQPCHIKGEGMRL